MCAVHTPICLIPDCHQPRSATGYFCISHSCISNDCDNVINGSSWCSDHKRCSVRDCGEMRVVTVDEGTEEGVCQKHLRKPCTILNCTDFVPNKEEMAVCSAHECAAASCHEARMNPDSPTELYCWNRASSPPGSRNIDTDLPQTVRTLAVPSIAPTLRHTQASVLVTAAHHSPVWNNASATAPIAPSTAAPARVVRVLAPLTAPFALCTTSS